MRTLTTLFVALALSACVDFDPKTGPLVHGPGNCGSASAYPTTGYPALDAGAYDAGCPTANATDSGYY